MEHFLLGRKKMHLQCHTVLTTGFHAICADHASFHELVPPALFKMTYMLTLGSSLCFYRSKLKLLQANAHM